MIPEEESVEAAAEARRERLRALRAAQELFDTPDDDATTHNKKPDVQDSITNNDNKIEEENEEELSAEQAARARRERLRSPRAAQELANTLDDDNSPDLKDSVNDDQEENVSMKFRNYLPHDKQLQEGKLAPSVLPNFEDPVAAEPPVEEEKENPFLNIAPKKPNWDLRRDVQKKLDDLEKRTQKAVLQLMVQEKEKRNAEEEGINGAEIEN